MVYGTIKQRLFSFREPRLSVWVLSGVQEVLWWEDGTGRSGGEEVADVFNAG